MSVSFLNSDINSEVNRIAARISECFRAVLGLLSKKCHRMSALEHFSE